MNYANSELAGLDPEVAAKTLALAGYRQISRSYRHVARVDLSDEEFLRWAKREDFVRPEFRLESLKDYYRRCEAKDEARFEGVPEEVMSQLRKYGNSISH